MTKFQNRHYKHLIVTVVVCALLVIAFASRTLFVSQTQTVSTTNSSVSIQTTLLDPSVAILAPTTKIYTVKVTSIVDGDTFHVLLNGKDEKVRPIGINCPEILHPDDPAPAPYDTQGQEATNFTTNWLSHAQDRTVYLLTYPSIAEKDKYGRILAYVYLTEPKVSEVSTAEEQVKLFSTSLNAALVRDGQACYLKVQDFPGLDILKNYADQAQANNKGLWPSGCFD